MSFSIKIGLVVRNDVSILLSIISDKYFYLTVINNLFLVDNESKKINQKKFDFLKALKNNFSVSHPNKESGNFKKNNL